MTELGDILNDTGEFELAGQTWTFSKLTLGLMADFETAMQSHRLKEARKALGPDATANERVELIVRMSSGQNAVQLMEDTQSMAGMRLLLYLCLKPHYPDMTKDDVGRLVTVEGIDEATALVELLSGPVAKDDGKGNATKATAGRRLSSASPRTSAGRPKSAGA